MTRIGVKEWPEAVPVLGPEHFTCGTYKGGNHERCLLGWARVAFCSQSYDRKNECLINDYEDTVGPLREVLDEMVKQVRGNDISDVAFYNDDHTPSACAKLWNRTMAKFGYTEDA